MFVKINFEVKMQIRHDIINSTKANQYCRDAYRIKITREAIEAYLAGKPVCCHHVLEISINNEEVIGRKELVRFGMYYNRPYFELLIISHAEHSRMHMLAASENRRRHLRENHSRPWLGKQHSTEAKAKMSVAVSKATAIALAQYNEYKTNGGALKWNAYRKWLKSPA